MTVPGNKVWLNSNALMPDAMSFIGVAKRCKFFNILGKSTQLDVYWMHSVYQRVRSEP